MKQLKFQIEDDRDSHRGFGGSLLAGKRKKHRPIDSKKSLHFVLRADTSQSPRLRQNYSGIKKSLETYAHRFGIRIYRYSISNSHIHLLIKVPSRMLYLRFIRSLTSQLSRKLKIKWSVRPWSRLVFWGKDYQGARSYIVQNRLEAAGEIDYQDRPSRPWHPPCNTK